MGITTMESGMDSVTMGKGEIEMNEACRARRPKRRGASPRLPILPGPRHSRESGNLPPEPPRRAPLAVIPA